LIAWSYEVHKREKSCMGFCLDMSVAKLTIMKMFCIKWQRIL